MSLTILAERLPAVQLPPGRKTSVFPELCGTCPTLQWTRVSHLLVVYCIPLSSARLGSLTQITAADMLWSRHPVPCSNVPSTFDTLPGDTCILANCFSALAFSEPELYREDHGELQALGLRRSALCISMTGK